MDFCPGWQIASGADCGGGSKKHTLPVWSPVSESPCPRKIPGMVPSGTEPWKPRRGGNAVSQALPKKSPKKLRPEQIFFRWLLFF